jgi:hypothetical protein
VSIALVASGDLGAKARETITSDLVFGACEVPYYIILFIIFPTHRKCPFLMTKRITKRVFFPPDIKNKQRESMEIGVHQV